MSDEEVPEFFCDVGEVRIGGRNSVVHKDVNRPVSFEEFVEHSGAIVGVSDVGSMPARDAPHSIDLGDDAIRGFVTFDIVDADVGTVFSEDAGNASADAASRTGYECFFAFEELHLSIAFLV